MDEQHQAQQWLRDDIRELRDEVGQLQKSLEVINSKLTSIVVERNLEKRIIAVIGGGIGAALMLALQWIVGRFKSG